MGRKLIDEAGNQYGRLTVLNRADRQGETEAYWLCKCACGNETTVIGSRLRSGKTRSCGCLRKESAGKSHIIDVNGHRFGRLTAISMAGINAHGDAAWLCKCDCGSEAVVSCYNLRSGATKSCGCLRKGTNMLPKGIASFNALFSVTRHSAKKRGYTWKLTKKQVAHLTKQPCNYCGLLPSQVFYQKGCNGEYVYTGIDRIDNEKGYTIDNVISCCTKCNRAKFTMTLEEFEEWITMVYKHLTKKEAQNG